MRAERIRRPRVRLVALAVAAVLLAGVAAGGLMLATRGFAAVPTSLDAAWAALVAPVAPVLEPVAWGLNEIGRRPLNVVVPLIIGTGLLVVRQWRPGIAALAAPLVTWLLTELGKHLVDRPRPDEVVVAVDPGSYPSGHTSNAAAIAITVALLFGRHWIAAVAVGWVAAMALSRTLLAAHWLTDVVAGAALGAAVALAVWALLGCPRLPVPPPRRARPVAARGRN